MRCDKMAELATRKFNPKSIKKLEKNYHLKHVLTTEEGAIKIEKIERGMKRQTLIHEVKSTETEAWGVFVKK